MAPCSVHPTRYDTHSAWVARSMDRFSSLHEVVKVFELFTSILRFVYRFFRNPNHFCHRNFRLRWAARNSVKFMVIPTPRFQMWYFPWVRYINLAIDNYDGNDSGPFSNKGHHSGMQISALDDLSIIGLRVSRQICDRSTSVPAINRTVNGEKKHTGYFYEVCRIAHSYTLYDYVWKKNWGKLWCLRFNRWLPTLVAPFFSSHLIFLIPKSTRLASIEQFFSFSKHTNIFILRFTCTLAHQTQICPFWWENQFFIPENYGQI